MPLSSIKRIFALTILLYSVIFNLYACAGSDNGSIEGMERPKWTEYLRRKSNRIGAGLKAAVYADPRKIVRNIYALMGGGGGDGVENFKPCYFFVFSLQIR